MKLIEFKRNPLSKERLLGFVIESNELLTLVHLYDHEMYQLNGWSVFLNSDARGWIIEPGSFLARAAKLRKLKPAAPDGVSIGSWKDVLTTAGAAFPLVTIHRERLKRGVCWIGSLRKVSQRAVTIRSISPQAKWEDDESYLLRDITMVEFGGTYERLLNELAE